MFNSRPAQVAVVYKVAVAHVYLRVLWLSAVIIIPPIIHTDSLVYQRRCVIPDVGSVVKKHGDRTPPWVTIPGFYAPVEEKLTTLQPRTGAAYLASLSILQIDNVLILYFSP